MSAPFVDQTFDFPQPDGSTITVRGTGNQDRATFETLDGRPLERDAAGFLVAVPHPAGQGFAPAPSPEPRELVAGLVGKSRWQQRRTQTLRSRKGFAAMAAPMPPSRPTVGTFVGLTLLVDFSDAPATIKQAEVEAFCNKPGYTGFGNNGSVFDYFNEVSNGNLQYTNIVAPYYRAKRPKSYYTDPAQKFGTRAQELIREALRFHIAKGFGFAPLTADAQNFIYALNVFYAGPCPNAWSKGLWPHQSTLGTKVKLADGRTFADYQITDMGDRLSLGTFCHENGHMVCDFPDLYPYVNGKGLGVGKYCLMCYGGTGTNATNPVHVGAYLKNEAGWGNAKTAAKGTNYALTAGKNEFVLHGTATDYYIIENRFKAGRDALLPDSGLAIWHVDETASNTNPTAHYECALIQADNLGELEAGANYGKAGDLFFAPTVTAFKGGLYKPKPGQLPLDVDSIGAAGATVTFKVR